MSLIRPLRRAWERAGAGARVFSRGTASSIVEGRDGRVLAQRRRRDADLPVIAFANRLPVRRTRNAWRLSDGGLVAALRPAMRSRGGVWVGWDGGTETPRHVPGARLRAPARLALAARGRRVLPRLREPDALAAPARPRRAADLRPPLLGRLPPRERALRGRRRSRAAGRCAGCTTTTCCSCPALLRGAASLGRIGFFLHVPFPPPEVFARLPWRTSVLEGMLGADVVSFHTQRYRGNFLRTCAQLLDDVRVDGTVVRLHDGRVVRTAAHPISIDAADVAHRAHEPGVERALAGLQAQFAPRRLLLGVDRLDYTKGIPERLRAIELLLELRPELRGWITFVQVAVPSRGEIREYRELRAQVEQLVGRINGRFTEPGLDVPVHYLYRGVTPDRLLAYYRAADVCLVTPLAGRDEPRRQGVRDGAGGDGRRRRRSC